MTGVVTTARILRYSALGGIQDFFAMYSVRTWLFGWLLRVLVQVIFFTLIGDLVGSEARVHYILIGNAAFLAAMTVLFVVQSTTWERMSGTIALLIASPANPLVVLLGRSLQWIPDAVASAVAAFLVVGPLFDLRVSAADSLIVVALLVLITVSTYFMGAFFGSLVLRFMGARNLVANLVHGSLMVTTGVNVPRGFFPGWVQAVSGFLPLTHGLSAIRRVVADDPAAAVWRDAGLEAAVGLLWLAIAVGSFTWFLEGGRRSGAIELSE